MHYAIIVIKKILHNYKKNFFGTMKKFLHNYKKIVSHNLSFLSWYNIKMDPKNMRLYVRNKSYFIVEKYQKDTCFYDEDPYNHYGIDVDRISLHKKATKNILLDIDIQIKWIFCHYN